MALRRGFKREANWYARATRKELGLSPHSALCPWELAAYLDPHVVGLSEVRSPLAKAHFQSKRGRKEFSAIILPVDSRTLIIHNDTHDIKRQAANIAHELAHALLIHPQQQLLDETGARNQSELLKEIEEEASWLGPALLISEEAALYIASRNMSVRDASDKYNASEDVVRMRINVTAAHKRVRNAA
jgi:Zn-dependent peptidase ImmA (M78 family)